MPIGSSPHGIGDIEVVNKINRTIDQTVNQTTERIDFRIIEPIKASTTVDYARAGDSAEPRTFNGQFMPEMGHPIDNSDGSLQEAIPARMAGQTDWIQPPTGTAISSYRPRVDFDPRPGLYQFEFDFLGRPEPLSVANEGMLSLLAGSRDVMGQPIASVQVSVPADDGEGQPPFVPVHCHGKFTVELGSTDSAWSRVEPVVMWSDAEGAQMSVLKTATSFELLTSLEGEE